MHGGFGFDNVAAPARDARIEGLYPLIESAVDPEFEQLYPAFLSTRIQVDLKNGQTKTGECRMEYGKPSESGPYSPRGTTTPPLDEAGMRRKFLDLACRRISREDAEAILGQIFEMEHA